MFRSSLVASLFLAISVTALADPVNPAEQMLNYFSATCPSQGAWTKAALGKASALVATLQAIQASPECNAMIGSGERLKLLESQVQTIASMNGDTSQLIHDRSLEQKILFMLTTTSDPTEAYNLRAQLTTLQLEITGLETDRNSRTSLNAEEETRILTGIAQNTDDFLMHASTSQACLMKNSSLLADVARLTGGIVSTLTAVNPALSLGVSAGSELFAKVLDAAKNYKLNRKIRKLNKATDVAAMSCVLESLSTDYCAADDAIRAIDWKNENGRIADHPPAGSLRSVVSLMDREVPALLDWLESVRTSALVSTVSDGDRVKDFFLRDAILQSTLPIARGLFNQRAPIMAAIPKDAPDSQRWNALKDTLITLMQKIGADSNTANPLFSVYPVDAGLYFLVGIQQDQIPKQPGAGYAIPFFQFDAGSSWPGGVAKPVYDDKLLPTILARLTTWYRDAQNRLGSERAKIVNPDALNTLTLCDEKNAGNVKVTPCTALTDLREFLDFRLHDPKMSLSFKRLYADTRDRLAKIEKVMNDLRPIAAPTPEQLSGALGEIYLGAQLENGTFFMKGRFDSLIRIAFTDLFESASPTDADMAAQSLASQRFMDALERVKSGYGLADIREDINHSLSLNQTTLDKFVDTFGQQIADVLEFLRNAELQNQPSDPNSRSSKARSFHDDRANMCLNLLNATNWPYQVDRGLCDGISWQPLPPRGPMSVTVTDSLISQSPERRMCKMRDVKRASDIFESRQQ